MTVPPVHHLRSTPRDPSIVCANFSFKMEFRRKCGWWTGRKTAETRETQPEEAPREKEGTRRKKRLLLFMQERQSNRKSRCERWRWKSFWKQQITPPDQVSNHSISGSLPGLFSNTAAESKQGDGSRRGRAPAVSTVEHEMPETFVADSCSLGVGYKKQVSGKEKKAVRRNGQDNADEFVRFSEQEHICSETDERKLAEEDVLAEDTQEDEGKDICSEYFRMTGPTNSPPPQAWESTRNEGGGGSKSKVCVNSGQEGREMIPSLGRLPPAGEQPIFSPSHKGPSSGRSAADSTIIASVSRTNLSSVAGALRLAAVAVSSSTGGITASPQHRNVPSTAATSCPPSPADTDQMSPFLSYPMNAASVVDCNLRAAGAAPVADASAAAGVKSLATAAVADSVAAKAALLSAAAIDEDGGVEFPAVAGLPISAATAVHARRERPSVDEQRLGAVATQTQSGCKRYPSDVADRSCPVLRTDCCAVKSLKKTFPAAQRSAAGAGPGTAAGRQSAAPFRCSYLARKAAPFSVKRLLPSAAAAATGAAPLQGADLRAAERATTFGRVLQQHAEKTSARFQEQQQTQQRRQNQEPNAQQYQPEQQHQWLRQQQPCRLQQPKALRFLLRAPLPSATHTQQGMTAQATVRHGNSPLEEAEAITFPPQLRFARFPATAEVAGGMPSPLAALLACPTGAARTVAAGPTATAPSKKAAASSAARAQSSDATLTTAAANKSLFRRVLRSALVENAPGFVSSTATPAETATAAHEVVPENSSPFRCVQVHDSRGPRADASALSPLSASSFVVSLPSAAPFATAAALGTSHHSIRRGTRSHPGSVCTGHHLGYDTAIPLSMDISPAAAQIAAAPGPEAEAEMMSAPAALPSSSVFSHPLTRSQAAPFRDSKAALRRPSSAVAATCKTPLPSQSVLSCPAALFSSPSLPARTRSSPDVQASGDQMLLPQQRQRRNSTPLNRAAGALCIGEMGSCTSHQEGQNSSNCAAGDDTASSANSHFDGICSSNAESEKQRPIATTCGLEAKKCRGEQAVTIGVRIRNSTSSSITATGPGTTIYNTVHMTAVTDGIRSTSGGPSVGIAAGLGAAGFDAAAGHKQESRQLGLQHRGNRQEKPPEAVNPGCPCMVDNIGELNRQQRNCGGEKFCNETSVISVEDSAVAQAEDTTTRQQRVNADSPQLLGSSGSGKQSTRPSTPDDVAASPASESTQTATTQGAAGAALEVDCFSSGLTRASLSSPREVSVFVAAHGSDVSAGHGALQNEQQHQCPTYHQQRQVREGGQQQSEQERPAEEPEERQRLRNFPKQPTHLAQSNQQMLLASLQEGQSIQASLLSEQQPGDFCNKEPQQQQRPTETDTSLHARPQVEEPLSVERVGEAQVNEQNNTAVQTCAFPGVDVSAADPPKSVVPASRQEVAVPAATGDARDRCAALQTDALGIVVPLGCVGADGEAHNFGNTLHSCAGAVRSTALDLPNKGQRATISNPGAGEAAYADLPITAAAAVSVEAAAKLYSATEDAAVDKEPVHVDPEAVAKSKGDQVVLAKSMRLVEPPPTATTTTTPADVGGEASVATLGVTAAATLSKPSSPKTVTAATAERTSTLTPAGAATTTLPAVSGKSPEAKREPVEATTSSTHPPAAPAATNSTARPAPDRGGDARSQEEKEGALTLTEAVLATVGQGVTAALEYGATTLRDFITESLPALSSDEDSTPDCSPSHQCLQRRRSSNTWRSGRDTQTFTRPQRERGERSRCIRRTCSAGTTRAAEASLQSRWERITNSSVLLPPPLLVRECMQPSAAAPTRRGLPPLSNTSRSHRRSNSFSEAMHRSHLQPVWYSAVLDRTQTRRSVSPAVLPGAVATTAADGGVEIVADPILYKERYIRATSPALSEPSSLYRRQLPDRIMQMPHHPVAASAARRAVATAGMLVSDLQGASTLVGTLGGESGFSRSGVQRSYSPLPVTAELCTAPSRMTGAKSDHPQLHTQTGRGLRPWQPPRSVCSPSAAAAGASWRSAAATPVSFSKITTPHALSPARTPHVLVPVYPTAAIIDSAAAAGPRAAGSNLEHTPAPASNGRASTAADNEKQRPRRGFVSLPPILPKSLQKEDRLARRHLQQAAQHEQQQTPSDWQESILRNGQASPLRALPGAGCISQTTRGNLPPQTGAQGQLEEPSLAEHTNTFQMQHYRELQQHNVQQQQERQHARENFQPVATPVVAALRFAAKNNDSSVASPEWELRPSSFTSNGGLRQPSFSGCNAFGGSEGHAVNRFSQDPSPDFPNCRAGGVVTPLQHKQAQVRQARHLLQPPTYPTAADPHPMPAVGCQVSNEHTAANSSAHPAQETNAARDAAADQPFHNILTLGAGAETATRAAACVATTATVRAPVHVEPQRVQYASSVTRINWTRGSSDAPASSMDPARSLLCWERQQRPCEYLESHRQQQRPEEIHAVHPGPAALEVRGNSPGTRVRHDAGTLLAAAGGSVGTHFADESHLGGGEERRRSSLLMIPNISGVPSWNPVQQQQQRMQRGAPPELPPLPTAASGQGLGGLLQAAGEPAADKVYEEGAMAAPPSTHRGERVVIDRAAAVAAMQDAAALAGEECTWGASYVPTRLPSARILPTILNTGTSDLGTASVGATGASSPVCADLMRERADRDAAQTAVPASPTTAARRARGDGKAAAEVGPQAGTPVPAMDKTRVCPPWGQPRLSNLQFTFQQQELQQCQELSELRQRQRGGPVQQSRPPSPLRARQLREELLRQHAAGQLSKDNFPLEEVESLLQDFHVRKVNGVLIYDVEGQETSRCPVPQSEAAGGAAVTFCLPGSRTAVGFGSDGGSTAGRQRAVTEEDEEFRIRTTANTSVRPNRRFDNSSSYSQVDSACCNNSSKCSSAHAIERPGGNTGSQSAVEGSRYDRPSTQCTNPCFDMWVRENHRVGEQFLKDVEQIVDVAASLYATDDTER